jgi:hypothetical protein
MPHAPSLRTTLLAAALLAAPAAAWAQETPPPVCYELALANPWPMLLPAHRDTLVLTHEPADWPVEPDALLAIVSREREGRRRAEDPPGRYLMAWWPIGSDSLAVQDMNAMHGTALRARRAGQLLEGRASTFSDEIPAHPRETTFLAHAIECPDWSGGAGS